VIQKFKEARAITLKFAEQTEVPLKAHTLDHPSPLFGTLNGYQWLIYIPLHNTSTPKGTRTPVLALRGLCPRPLDDGGKTM
jgi:hypothetical protein